MEESTVDGRTIDSRNRGLDPAQTVATEIYHSSLEYYSFRLICFSIDEIERTNEK